MLYPYKQKLYTLNSNLIMKKIFYWLPRLIASVILLQTLYFKFGAHPESVHLFTQLGVEPYGRIGTGIIELILAILLLIPKTSLYGAIGTVGVMIGAIFSHFLVLGVNIGDGGTLFILAIVVLISALIVLYQEKEGLFKLKNKFLPSLL